MKKSKRAIIGIKGLELSNEEIFILKKFGSILGYSREARGGTKAYWTALTWLVRSHWVCYSVFFTFREIKKKSP